MADKQEQTTDTQRNTNVEAAQKPTAVLDDETRLEIYKYFLQNKSLNDQTLAHYFTQQLGIKINKKIIQSIKEKGPQLLKTVVQSKQANPHAKHDVQEKLDEHTREFTSLCVKLAKTPLCGGMMYVFLLKVRRLMGEMEWCVHFLEGILKAAELGRTHILRAILDRGGDANAQNDQSVSPLHLAAKNNRYECVRVLCDWGAHVDAQNKDCVTPLVLAATNGHLDVCKLLISRGAEINLEGWMEKPLHQAVQNRHYDVARLLLDRGAHVDGEDSRRRTPLHVAKQNNDVQMVQLLRSRGGDKIKVDPRGWYRDLEWM
eukprot:GDKI01033958.1.p1 GENE.GDKI01033958.1~~GDKI01033958.1.p1  ORF type:complete len:368 (-),score=48.41 GDKI01033958.1:20-967(-)